MTTRWPPAYDANDLEKSIKELISPRNFPNNFYQIPSRSDFNDLCQGDIVNFNSSVPLIWEDGEVVEYQDFEHWLVVGNTCDISRSVDSVPFTNIIPIIQEDLNAENSALATESQTYKASRRFYLPSWDAESAKQFNLADFTLLTTIHKEAIRSQALVVARLTYTGWLLLHSCLVRYLARDDGRYD